jgi:opine dehydrogenase
MSARIRVCICGGGHVAHALAAVMGANPDVSVRVATRNPGAWSAELHGVHGGLVVVGRPELVTADVAVALDGADIVLLAAPAFAHREIMTKIRRFVAPRSWVGALPAAGFFDWAAASELPEARIFGAQRSPFNCRVTIPGREVDILGVVPRLAVAASPRRFAAELVNMLGVALSLPIDLLDNFLCVTLSPSSSIFHAARMHALLTDWDGSRTYQDVPLFYEDWDDAASELYLRCDAELQTVCRRIPLDMSGVTPASRHYGVSTASALTARIRSLEGLRGIAVPMQMNGKGNLPDVRNRYFLEDFPFGVEAVRTVAALAGIETPTLDEIDAWSQRPPIAPPQGTRAGCASRVCGRSLNDLVLHASR